MCKLRAADFNYGSIPRANYTALYAELRKKQEENRKESTRRAARGTGGGGGPAARGGRRRVGPPSWSYGRDEIGDPPAARNTDSTLYGAGGVTEGDRGEGKGKPRYVVPPSPRARAQA